MEAYILHIKYTHTTYYETVSNGAGTFSEVKLDPPPKYSENNVYTAWVTEKQAHKEVARVILESIDSFNTYKSIFHTERIPSLFKALKILIDNNYIEEALNLVSEYNFSNTASNITIKFTVKQSTFKGSAFE